MKRMSISLKIYIGLIVSLSVISAINVLLPQGAFLPMQELPASKPILAIVNAAIMLVFYGGLGLIGLNLSKKLGFTDIWDSKVSNNQRFFIPAFIGIGLGIIFIITDVILSQFHTLSPLPHPPFPTSLVASAAAGIGEEIIFRLFFISFWIWLISYVIMKKKWQNQIFYAITVLSAIVFTAGHFPAIMIFYDFNTINEIPIALMTEILILNSLLSIFAACYFRKFGLLAAIGIHFWADIVWHVIWGLFNC